MNNLYASRAHEALHVRRQSDRHHANSPADPPLSEAGFVCSSTSLREC